MKISLRAAFRATVCVLAVSVIVVFYFKVAHVNPTAVAQLKAVVDAGEIMPQKSTYFFPKLASGLLIDPIDPAEEVPEGT